MLYACIRLIPVKYYRMHFKRLISYLWLLLPAAILILPACNSCNRPSAGNETIPPAAAREENNIREWSGKHLVQWSGWLDSITGHRFTPDSLQHTLTDTLPRTDTFIMAADRFRDFQPFFVYSPDSTLILDMVSYGNILHRNKKGAAVLESGEPDTEVAIMDAVTRRRYRILFAGPSTVIRDASWLDNTTVLIGGGMYDEHNELQPILWKYNVKEHTLESWNN